MYFKYYLILILLIFSLLWNLWIYPLYLEEPRRAVIALEMSITGNYIVPTIMGELYYAKPPLFNWIILFTSKILGNFSEFSVRLPTVVSLLLIVLFHYIVSIRYVDKDVAFFSSISFVTSGTILFYFSLLGEIDIFYSLITYLCIISVFWFIDRNIYLMFLFSFLFASFGFLTKGFPSVIFLYVTLLIIFFMEKKIKLLFSVKHLYGIFVFIFIVGFYFYLYSNQASLSDYIRFLWKESSQRTVVENQLLNFITHLFSFPVDTFIALFPWSLLILVLFSKAAFKTIMSNKFLKFSFLVFLLNYFVYWISPGANQRYVYMLYPFLLTVFAYFYFVELRNLRKKIVDITLSIVVFLLSIVSFSVVFIDQFSNTRSILFLSVISGFIFIFLGISSFKKGIYYTAIALVWFRILFDFVYLPVKAKKGSSYFEKLYGNKVAKITQNQPLFFLGNEKVDYGLLFYIENGRKDILFRKVKIDQEGFYLLKRNNTVLIGEKILSFKIKDNYALFKVITKSNSDQPIKPSIP